jgi:hypothetical protein
MGIVANQIDKPADVLGISERLLFDRARVQIHGKFQAMKRMTPRPHTRIHEGIAAARADACYMRVIVNELSAINILKGPRD